MDSMHIISDEQAVYVLVVQVVMELEIQSLYVFQRRDDLALQLGLNVLKKSG